MKTHTIARDLWIPRPIEEVFEFFADAGNLQRITPPWLHFRILNPPAAITQGTRIDYKLRIHGVPLRWQSEITDWCPPHRFVDQQRRGPYRLWIHRHTFEEDNNGTRVRDHVEYAALGGALVRKFLVDPDLEKIFDFRSERLREIWGVRE